LGRLLDDRAPTRAFWRGHFEVWELNVLTQREYCERHELSLKNFGNWQAQLNGEDAVGTKRGEGGIRRLDLCLDLWLTKGPLLVRLVPARVDFAVSRTRVRVRESRMGPSLGVKEAVQTFGRASFESRRRMLALSLPMDRNPSTRF
jgi:hypothetical protein